MEIEASSSCPSNSKESEMDTDIDCPLVIDDSLAESLTPSTPVPPPPPVASADKENDHDKSPPQFIESEESNSNNSQDAETVLKTLNQMLESVSSVLAEQISTATSKILPPSVPKPTKKRRTRKCLNDSCKSGKSPDYPKARKIALIYYGIVDKNMGVGVELEGLHSLDLANDNGNGGKGKKYYICASCSQEVYQYTEMYIEALKTNLPVYKLDSLKFPDVTIDIDDDESDEDGDSSSSESSDEALIEELDFTDIEIEGEITDVISKIMGDLHVKDQVELCHEFMSGELDDFGKSLDDTENDLLKCEQDLEKIRVLFNDFIGPEHTQVILRTVEIGEDGRVSHIGSKQAVRVQGEGLVALDLPQRGPPTSNANQKPSPASRKSPISGAPNNTNQPAPKSYRPAPASVKAKLMQKQQGQQYTPKPLQMVQSQASSTSTLTYYQSNPDAGNDGGEDDDDEIQCISPVLPPPPGLIPLNRSQQPISAASAGPEFTLGDTPKVLPKMIPGKGRSVYVMRTDLLNFWVKGKVQDNYKSQITDGMEFKVLLDGTGNRKGTQTKITSGKHISFGVPTPFVLPVGARVIAKFKDDFNNEPVGNGEYYAGIVAEKPAVINRRRYLIFFDDGYAQYVDYRNVLWVCECSREVWRDVHPTSQGFTREYLENWPERPMVRLQKNQVVSTERKGGWLPARVVEVDCSLAKIYFETVNKYEWIYRGSTRLSPMFQQEQNRKQAHASPTTPRRRTYNFSPRAPRIEYKYTQDDDDAAEGLSNNSARNPNNTARKSTAAPPPIGYMLAPGKKFPKELAKNYKSGFNISTVEHDGKLMKNGIPDDILPPKKFSRHDCGPACVRPYDDTRKEYRLINPLQLPFHLGFARENAKIPKRQVFYVAPCGRRLRDYKELYAFLRKTRYNLAIDHFCYDFSIDVLSEFVPSKTHYTLDDCSFGKETTPVQCVNAIDSDFPELGQYSKDRQAGNGVNLNLDEDFLACCDCEDDCADRSKCSCHQLTVEGTKLVPGLALNFEDEPGYQYKRLTEHVVSGIYECNSKCKCKSTCLNRVVQHDLKWQLQVFKTANKGWAIRPLHDIPSGSFICVYAGQILTDCGADTHGKAFGDEYLAELDYIEVMEQVKENYEAEAVGPGLDNKQNYKDMKNDYVISLVSSSESDDGDEDYKQEFFNRYDRDFKMNHSFDRDAKNHSIGADSGSPQKTETRSLFGEDEQCYIMDAKSVGNIGRYLNHSCTPNVFVQNVFVDTHDLRFPWVAFFAFKNIRAGTELTWDYNYNIGSVPDKIMYCYCGTPECRGRLL